MYEYNGLSHRIEEQADLDPVVSGFEESRDLYYNPSWQIVEEHVFEGARFASRKQNFWGLRHIDDLIASRRDVEDDSVTPVVPPNGRWFGASGDGNDVRHFYLTDSMFSVRSILDADGNPLGLIDYDAYGRSRIHWMSDMNRDGISSQADQQAFANEFFAGTGDPESRANLRGLAAGPTQISSAIFTQAFFMASNSKKIGSSSFSTGVRADDNRFGWHGYRYDPHVDVYHVRLRAKRPGEGRWLQRDPAGFVDGSNLYQYGRSNPVRWMDNFGLSANEPLNLNALDLRSQLRILIHARRKWKRCSDECFRMYLTATMAAGLLAIEDRMPREAQERFGGSVGNIIGAAADIHEVMGEVAALEGLFDELDEIDGKVGRLFDVLEDGTEALGNIHRRVGWVQDLATGAEVLQAFNQIDRAGASEFSGRDQLVGLALAFSLASNAKIVPPGVSDILNVYSEALRATIGLLDAVDTRSGRRNARDLYLGEYPGASARAAWGRIWTGRQLRRDDRMQPLIDAVHDVCDPGFLDRNDPVVER
ncbi:MAG: RHS repeat-associated core domain-containing protein [Planctomycetota bacterium]